jgi:hypothetical protein
MPWRSPRANAYTTMDHTVRTDLITMTSAPLTGSGASGQ